MTKAVVSVGLPYRRMWTGSTREACTQPNQSLCPKNAAKREF